MALAVGMLGDALYLGITMQQVREARLGWRKRRYDGPPGRGFAVAARSGRGVDSASRSERRFRGQALA